MQPVVAAVEVEAAAPPSVVVTAVTSPPPYEVAVGPSQIHAAPSG